MKKKYQLLIILAFAAGLVAGCFVLTFLLSVFPRNCVRVADYHRVPCPNVATCVSLGQRPDLYTQVKNTRRLRSGVLKVLWHKAPDFSPGSGFHRIVSCKDTGSFVNSRTSGFTEDCYRKNIVSPSKLPATFQGAFHAASFLGLKSQALCLCAFSTPDVSKGQSIALGFVPRKSRAL